MQLSIINEILISIIDKIYPDYNSPCLLKKFQTKI